MSKHRAEPAPRLRVGRLVAATASLTVTAVAMLGGLGVIPVKGNEGAAATDRVQAAGAATDTEPAGTDPGQEVTGFGAPQDPTATPSTATAQKKAAPPADALPAGTGTGRRVVFSETAQRVWLVDRRNRVVSTYLVSGSVTDNLHPGRYNVYSKSRWAVGIEDSGVMQYFVRFTRGANAAIGFHSIPTKNGDALQTVAQLGTPQSHGCIRQKLTDAERLWEFAPVGTRVVVV